MARWVLAIIIALFLLLRLPPVLHQPGGPDEEWYAIPGLTIAQEGYPKVPYSRATEKGSVFLGAERMLFAMPPLSFYAQAPFFLVLPPTYSTARLASLVAGCLAIVLVYAIGRLIWQEPAKALWGVGIYSVSRLLYFPAMIARPDMLCGMLGLAAVAAMYRWSVSESKRARWLVLSGAFLGLAGLAHPFAIVMALQLGTWGLLASGSPRDRLIRPLVLACVALVAFSVWLLLIVREPALFRSQFIGNIIEPAGPGLAARLLFPWREIREHLPLVIERAGYTQAAFLASALGGVIYLAWRRRDSKLGWLAAMGWSGVYLLIASQGTHPLQGYWCYPLAFFALGAGWCMERLFATCRSRAGLTPSLLFSALILALTFIPGSGLRTTWACLRHGGQLDYQPHAFTKAILATLPPNAQLTVGAEFALDAFGANRNVLLGIRYYNYFDATKYPYDYAIMGRSGMKEGLDKALNARVVRRYGNESDPFACYAVLLEPEQAVQKTPSKP